MTILAVWSGVTCSIMCFVKWSWNTRTLATLGGLFSSMVVSMLVKSIYKRSIEPVATIRCRGVLGKWPSCYKQCLQDLIGCWIWLVLPGHQKHSHNKDKVQSCPWCPASAQHPFKVATQWGLGTMKSKVFSVSPLGIKHRYKAPWCTTNLCWYHRISLPSSLEECSARRTFKFVCFCAFSQSNTVISIKSSLLASAQSVTWISTSAWYAVTCTFCSKHWSPSTMDWSWSLAWYTTPSVTALRMDFTVSGSSWVVTQLGKSATMLSCPFWYSSLKWNHTRAPTHQWPVAFRLGVDIMYVRGLLSAFTRNDW